MNAKKLILLALQLPPNFGSAELPYVHFTATAEDGNSGDEITLGYQDEGAPEAHFAHTDWVMVEGRRRSTVQCSAIVDWESGAVRYVEGDAEALERALAIAPGLTRGI